MAARAHRHGVLIALHPVVARAVAHGSRREVHLSGHHAYEGEGDVIARHVGGLLSPPAFLHAEDTLVVDNVGIGAAHSRRGVEPMIVKDEVVLGTLGGDTLGHLYRRLVVTVEEVDLEARNTHGAILDAGLLQMFVEYVEHRPEHDPHPFLACISDDSPQVHLRDGVHQVAFFRVVPSLVDDDVLQSVACCEVYII